MYVAVKGGERAIKNAHKALGKKRRGDVGVKELSVRQIQEQLPHAVDRVMTEGSLYDPELAALAIKQACGDLIEGIFLLRAYRTTLPRFISTRPINTDKIDITRRISAAFKDAPGGQMLGPTFDYTHRLLDFSLLEEKEPEEDCAGDCGEDREDNPPISRIVDFLDKEGLVEKLADRTKYELPGDLTREPLLFPVDRDVRLQNLVRADEGFILSMGYSSERGFASTGGHPFVVELRVGEVDVEIVPEELGFTVCIGEITVTEGDVVSVYSGSDKAPPQFARGYGLVFGYGERKVISMAQVDRALRCRELGEDIESPVQDEEFVLSHSDNVQATGFVEHLKLPHHVDFQGELEVLRRMRDEWEVRVEKRKRLMDQTAQNDKGQGETCNVM
ncbi:alpha-D-ribose 1-methylphosphonate 5-triphosphate synthase subunit PhnI [Desulfocicer vacuolatum DSM 3385]|uniref:Alpha-D-ribose 1-methylphosphonate 5-triphosphate synthase subunit PhnI n=1 Tax=Desulfocicer vacuolatum DSM 3385 TaxID=1121400 RepID=A0A1W2ESP4_9BACT|nr:carbon-phosphorus lyase complex subunit PhnI [Desulfocicer vacuolatum]SMD12198.1 alpha-D-ribose 1-methylphosphonate 5-triphosphate synthase subunit PhnI [Desulfocicer vacuolatum DSM 3385]